MKNLILCVLLLSPASGCASAKKSALLGLATGSVSSAAGGYHIGGKRHGKRFAKKGLVIGGIAGLVAGLLIHIELEKRDRKSRRDAFFELEKFGAGELPVNGAVFLQISNKKQKKKVEK